MAHVSTEAVQRYALIAVADERDRPYHGKRVGYDRLSAMNDVLNHFSALTVSDAHWVEECVSEAEDKLGVVA